MGTDPHKWYFSRILHYIELIEETNTNDDEIPEIVTDQKKSDDDSDDEDAPEIDLSSLSFKEDIKEDDEVQLSFMWKIISSRQLFLHKM